MALIAVHAERASRSHRSAPLPSVQGPLLEKIKELVERSNNRIGADVVYDDHVVLTCFAVDE